MSTPTVRTAAELLCDSAETCKLSFGCQGFDDAFGGGVPVHGVTEICGEAGAGKTQLCLQLTLQAQLPVECGGLGAGKAVYLSCGEGAFPLKRLNQLADSVAARYADAGVTADKLMDSVLIQTVDSVDGQFEVRRSLTRSAVEFRDEATPLLVPSPPRRRVAAQI
mmetsp:Transcript_55860/g.154005  ORF Transcript_55860/g.154005 Transcript_55860/m.154005 type:complete len:165 (-) Transcript_55860:496-990(-)